MLSSSERKKHRQEKILFSLERLKFATREQLQKIHQLGGDRNALKVLNEMKEYFHIQNHEGMNVYYLNKPGRDRIGSETELKWTLQAEHHLMRNDIYIHFNQPADWRIEEDILFRYTEGQERKHMKMVPDATFTLNGVYHFLEVDRTQSMLENKKKIEHYAKLSPVMLKQYGHQPVLIFYTLTELRRNKLKEICQLQNVKCEVYIKEDIL